MLRKQSSDFFLDELKEIYYAENRLISTISQMIGKTFSDELTFTLNNHLDETEEHVKRLKKIFEEVGEKTEGKKCEAMEGLIKESNRIMQDFKDSPLIDAALLSVVQRIEHYEIVSYGFLITFAEHLGYSNATDLLNVTLNEEKIVYSWLAEIDENERVKEEVD
jgi:ferritin-like metal-binding protein YciE